MSTTLEPLTTVLFLGSKARVDSGGNFEFSNADLRNRGSLLVNQEALNNVVTQFNADLNFMRSNTDKASIDSLTEIVDKAADIVSIVDTERAARLAAGLAESAARELADNIAKELSLRESVELPVSITVFADGKQPIAKEVLSSLDSVSIGYDGWYFKNILKGNKINWYIPVSKGLKNKDIHKLYMKLLCVNNVSLPWITVYTVKKDGPDANNRGSWYNSRYNYLPADGQVFDKLKAYQMIVNLNLASPTLSAPLNHTPVDLFEGLFTLKSTSASGEDEILAIAVSSDSSSSAENVEFVMSNVLIQGPDGISSFNFRNADVLTKFTNDRLDQVFKSFYGKALLDTTFSPQAAPAWIVP